VEVLGAWLTARPYIRTLVKKKTRQTFRVYKLRLMHRGLGFMLKLNLNLMPSTQVKKAAESDFECERLWAQYAKTVIQQLEAIFFVDVCAHTHTNIH
jgi:hypothetical protein